MPDFDAAAPTPPAAWKVRLAHRLTRLPPYRVPVVRRAVLRAWRELRRRRRRRAEARGERFDPSLYAMGARLAPHLPPGPGVFVEAGANDGFEQSNTYALERYHGWTGILVEPVPELYREVVRERPRARAVQCALVPAGHAGGEVEMHYGGLMSVVAGAQGSEEADRSHTAQAFVLGLEEPYDFRVRARTLSDVLDEAGAPPVDLLSLDVEGYEVGVLQGLDLERHAPRLILVEILDMAAGRPAIEAVLGERYAALEQLSPYDMLYGRVSTRS